MEKNFLSFINKYENLVQERVSFVVATMVDSRGSAPQDVGARIIVDEGEILFGTIGGGKIEARVTLEAKDMLSSKTPTQFRKWNLQKDIGMTCGGEVQIFFESYIPQNEWNITIFGAGHVSQQLCRTLLSLQCHITCVDNRKDWLDKLPKDKKLKTIYKESMSEYVSSIEENSFVILMTMGHGSDAPILTEILNCFEFPYVGVIGSMAKRNALDKYLIDKNVQERVRDNYICPIGASIGNNSPAEIAISITSQLLKCRDQVFKTKKRL